MKVTYWQLPGSNSLFPFVWPIDRFHMTSRQPYLCTKNIYILWELNSFHMLDFFYSKQFAKLQTTWLKTIYIQEKSWIMISSRVWQICGARVYRAVILGISKKNLWRSLRLFLNLFLYFLPIFGGGFKLITITQISHRTTCLMLRCFIDSKYA